MKKQNQHDDYKENILENQNKFDILTKDLVCNIEKRVLKRTNKNWNILTRIYSSLNVYNTI